MIERNAVLLALGALMIAGPAFGAADCTYKEATYSNGSAACQSGRQYRCDDGQWKGLSIACSEEPQVALKACVLSGTNYYHGSVSCLSNSQYRCDDGVWSSLGIACMGAPEAAMHRASVGRTCMYNGATVATESSICKSGVAFRCNDGEWSNLGTVCQ